MDKYYYARVSSRDQNLQRQINVFKEIGAKDEEIYKEEVSGKNIKDRIVMNDILKNMGVGDTLIVKELDRLGRNLKDIKSIYELLRKKKCYIKVLENDILSTYGKSEVENDLIQPIIIHLLGYISEAERKKIKQRQEEGIRAMKVCKITGKRIGKKNKPMGRPPVLDDIPKRSVDIIKKWIDKEIKLNECISLTKISRATLYRIKPKIVEQLKKESEKEYKKEHGECTKIFNK